MKNKIQFAKRFFYQLLAVITAIFITGQTTHAQAISGTKKLLVVTIELADKQFANSCRISSEVTMPNTSADIFKRFFDNSASADSIHRIYKDSSDNKVAITGEVIGPIKINVFASDLNNANSAFCTRRVADEEWTSIIRKQVDAALAARGINISNYDVVNYLLPPDVYLCNVIGLGQPGVIGRTWLSGCVTPGVGAHELGHSFGLAHASTATAEYGDLSSPMGGTPESVEFNAPNRVAAGWLTAPTSVTDVTTSNTHNLNPLGGSGVRVLRIRKPDTNENYYLSVRTPEGLDSNMRKTYPHNYLQTLSIHRGTGVLTAKTTLLANLVPGQTWADVTNGISISMPSISTTAATVAVTFGPATCIRKPPTVVVEPSTQETQVGTPAWYLVTITNNNTDACGPSDFDLSKIQPPQPRSWINPPYLKNSDGSVIEIERRALFDVKPGATVTFQLGMKAVIGATLPVADNTYPFKVIVSDSIDELNATTKDAEVVIKSGTSAACSRLSPSVSLTPSSQKAPAGQTLTYQLTIKNNNSASCNLATFNIARTLPGNFTGALPSSVQLASGTSTTLSWKVTPATTVENNTYSLSASVVDTLSTSAPIKRSASFVVGPIVCVRAAPSISVKPTSLTGKAGEALRYQLVVKNNSNAACTSSTFNLSQKVASGLTGSLSTNSLPLAPGASATVNWTVTSSTAMSKGSYGISASVIDTAATTNNSGAASASYVIPAADCVLAPPTLTLSPSTRSSAAGQSVTYQVLAKNNNSATCDPLALSLSQTLPQDFDGDFSVDNLSLASGESKSVDWTVTSSATAQAANYTVKVTLNSGSNTNSAATQSGFYTVTSSSNGGGNNNPPINPPTPTPAQPSATNASSDGGGGALGYLSLLLLICAGVVISTRRFSAQGQ